MTLVILMALTNAVMDLSAGISMDLVDTVSLLVLSVVIALAIAPVLNIIVKRGTVLLNFNCCEGGGWHWRGLCVFESSDFDCC